VIGDLSGEIEVYLPGKKDRYVLAPNDAQVPQVERWLTRHHGILKTVRTSRSGQGLTYLAHDRPVGIRPTPSPAIPVQDWPHEEHCPCGYCGAVKVVRRPDAHPIIRFPRRPNTDFFLVQHSSIMASERILDALAEAGLDAGLTAHEVAEASGSDLRWFWLAGQQLEPAPAAFGLWCPTCPECASRPIARYQALDIYLPPEKPLCWMDPPYSLPPTSPILVSGQVYRWLMGPGARFLSPYQRERRMSPKVQGWYPRDADAFYIPRCDHAPDTVVCDPAILEHMTAKELRAWPTPPRGPEPKWRKLALDRGQLHDLERALAWEHDVVYILDLARQDMDQLRDEDLACFRNLNQLILRGTRLTRVPDAVFGLPNLRRLDLRDTPIPAEEIGRIRVRLGKGVRLQVSRR